MTTKDEDNTDNKGLNLPAIGAVTDWASQYRQNFIDIDDALKNVFTDRIAKPIVEAAVIEGDVVGGEELTKIDGAGLGINDDGELVLTAEFDGIEGLTNPLVENVDADGFDIENVGDFSSQNATIDGTTSTEALEAEGINNIVLVQNGDDLQSKIDEGGPGSLVFVEPGTYQSSDRYEPYPNQTIKGYSRDSVVLSVDDSSTGINFNANDAEGATVRDLTVNSPDAESGIIFSNRVETTINNVRVVGGGDGEGIRTREDRSRVIGCYVDPVDGDEISFESDNGICDQNIVNGTVSISGENVEGSNVTY